MKILKGVGLNEIRIRKKYKVKDADILIYKSYKDNWNILNLHDGYK